MRIFGFNIERRAKYSFENEISMWPSLGNIFSGGGSRKLNEWQSMQISVVYACIRLISNSIAMMPLSLYKGDGDSSRIASEKPLNNVLYRAANKELTAFTFKQTMMAHVLMFGNAYAEKVYNGAGEIIELWPMAPWNMAVEIKNGNKIYKYKLDNEELLFNSNEILHIPGLSFDGVKGYSPLQVMKNEIELAYELQQFGTKYFKNGTNLGAVLEHPGKLGEKARQFLKTSLVENYTGSGNALKTMVLEEGMKYNKMGIPAEDAQFISSRKFQLEEICRYYGVQLHMIQNLDKSSFNNIEQQSQEFKTYCLGPWAVIWEQEIWKSLSDVEKYQGYFAKYNFNALLRADYKTRMEGHRTAVQMGMMSLNEVRKLEDMNPIPDEMGGNTYWVNSAMLPIERQLQEPVMEPESDPMPVNQGGEGDE